MWVAAENNEISCDSVLWVFFSLSLSVVWRVKFRSWSLSREESWKTWRRRRTDCRYSQWKSVKQQCQWGSVWAGGHINFRYTGLQILSGSLQGHFYVCVLRLWDQAFSSQDEVCVNFNTSTCTIDLFYCFGSFPLLQSQLADAKR